MFDLSGSLGFVQFLDPHDNRSESYPCFAQDWAWRHHCDPQRALTGDEWSIWLFSQARSRQKMKIYQPLVIWRWQHRASFEKKSGYQAWRCQVDFLELRWLLSLKQRLVVFPGQRSHSSGKDFLLSNSLLWRGCARETRGLGEKSHAGFVFAHWFACGVFWALLGQSGGFLALVWRVWNV